MDPMANNEIENEKEIRRNGFATNAAKNSRRQKIRGLKEREVW